jgi:hypothetical protein
MRIYYEDIVQILCQVSSVRQIKFYIPGETVETDKMRRKAFERGVFTALAHIMKEGPEELSLMIRQKVFDQMDLNDLSFHQKILEAILEGKNQQGNESDDEEPPSAVINNSKPVGNESGTT